MNFQPWAPYLSIAVIILGIAITVLVLIQTKGSDLGGFMGGDGGGGGNFRTRRGIEATLHRITIYTIVLFFLLVIMAFLAWGQAI